MYGFRRHVIRLSEPLHVDNQSGIKRLGPDITSRDEVLTKCILLNLTSQRNSQISIWRYVPETRRSVLCYTGDKESERRCLRHVCRTEGTRGRHFQRPSYKSLKCNVCIEAESAGYQYIRNRTCLRISIGGSHQDVQTPYLWVLIFPTIFSDHR
jgi:hypothetical protein